jgi:hypothetical protein
VIRLFGWLHRAPRDEAGTGVRRIVPPSVETIRVLGTAERQSLLLGCDRAPSLFQLTPDESAQLIAVMHSDGRQLGHLAEADTPTTRHYQRELRRVGRRGQQLWVHGQLQREGLELVLLLRCPAPQSPSGQRSGKR